MTQPTLPFQPVRQTFGNLTIHVDPTVDGGYSINVFAATGGHRYNELCFGTFGRDLAVLAYRTIRDGAIQGVKPEGIAEAVRDELAWMLYEAQRRRDTPSRLRVERINLVLDQLQSPADAALLAELGEALRNQQVDNRQPAPAVEPATEDRPRNLAEWKIAYEAGVARDRAERTGAAA